MRETPTGKELQRIQTRRTSGSVVGTTTGVAVLRKQFREDRIPSKQDN